MTRVVIVNADDFGRSPGINRGVIEAHERGVVTSASLMVRWPAAEEAATYARSRTALSVGLHVDLGEWEYRDGGWTPLYSVSDDPRDELSRQLACFRDLMGRDPTHIDSHQHVHRGEPVRSAMIQLALDLGVPARELVGAGPLLRRLLRSSRFR
jgi:chitin disaccharide deacetylase